MAHNKKDTPYLDQISHWQQNQYSPGHFLGGDLHPLYLARTTMGGYFLLASGVITLGIFGYLLVADLQNAHIGFVITVIVSILEIFVGIKFLRNKKSH